MVINISIPHSSLAYVTLSKALIVASEYALTNPPVPSNIPPKYLVTITKILFISFFSIIFKIEEPNLLTKHF